MSTASPRADQGELIRGLAVLTERPGPTTRLVAEALGLPVPDPVEHTEIFVHQLAPYASIYLDQHGKIGGEARERIAGFWRAMRLTPPVEPDHLAALLGLWAAVGEEALEEATPERRRLLDHAATTLAWEHLASWLPPYLARVKELSALFRPWAALLEEVIQTALGDAPDTGMPSHLIPRQRGPEGPDDLVPFLLTPIRSGLVLTRSDLQRAASDLGLGTRIGERAYDLRSLLGQDGPAVASWIADEAGRQSAIYSAGSLAPALGAFWSARATQTRRWLMIESGNG